MNTGIFRLLLSATSIGFATLAIADTDKNRELNEVQAKIHQLGADMNALSADRAAQTEILKKLEKQYGEQANALNTLKTGIKQQEESLQELRNKISTTQKDMKTQQRGLEGLIKSAYAIGDHEGLKVMLNQRDPGLPGRMLVYHDYVSKARQKKLQAIQEDFTALQQLEAQKDAENQLLQSALEKKQQETDKLQNLKNQREKLLAELDDSYASKQEQMTRLVHDEKKLEALVASLQKTDDNAVHEPSLAVEIPRKQEPEPQAESEPQKTQPKINAEYRPAKAFADQQGQLPWPVQGAITEHFGSRRFETTWDGAVISAREGADIRSVASGRVVYADWLRGYGLMLIVDHGGGYLSLYAFNQSLRKNVGEQVRAGETLASVGRSGGRSQAALYFGIRKKGRPVDPEQWCKRTAEN